MHRKNRLETVASALYAVNRADVLVDVINAGLNGNRVYRAENRNGTVYVMKTNQKGNPEISAQITDEGRLVNADKSPVGAKFAESIENAVPLSAVIEVESRTVPATRALAGLIEQANHVMDQTDNKVSLGVIESGKDLDGNRHTLKAVSKFADIGVIADRMNRFTGDAIEVVDIDDAIVLRDAAGNRLASLSPAKAEAINITAESAMTVAFRTVLTQLDAETGLAAKMSENRKEVRAEEQALAQARLAERQKARRQAEVDKATALVDEFRVSAGETFVLKREDWHEDHGWVWNEAVMIAEKDLDAKDFLEVLNYRTEGLARTVSGKELYIHDRTKNDLQAALDLLNGEETPRPE